MDLYATKKLSISISDSKCKHLGIAKSEFSFSEFEDIVSKSLAERALNRSLEQAKEYNVSQISMDEVSEEIKAYRNEKKGNS
jgi:hypothetical protein